MPDSINWDHIKSKDNHSIEELSYEEQQTLKEYERNLSEEELHFREMVDNDPSYYL